MDHLPARLETFIRSLQSNSKILIPGCGEDYRPIEAFHRAGHDVTAIDFSPVAVERTRKALTALSERIILGDFFSYDFGQAGFDFLYERTFLCGLPPTLWKNYAKRIAELLRPRGRLVGFFFYGEEADPPPFPLDQSTADELFHDRFQLIQSEPVTDSLPIFVGREKWQEWQLRS